MDTTRYALGLLTSMSLFVGVNGQEGTVPSGALYQLWAEKQAEFALTRQTVPDEQFFAEGGEHAHFQRWYRTWEARLAPHGDMSIYDRVVGAYFGRQRSHSAQRSNGDPWHEIGPLRRRNNMVGIGPIRSISISDVNSDHMLCTSSSGGVFYTTNANTDCQWQNAGSDYWPTSGCQSAIYYPGTTDQWFAISSYDDGRVARVGGVMRKQSSNPMWDDDPIGDHVDFGGYHARIEKLLFDKKLNSNQDHRLFVTSNRGIFYTDNPTGLDPAWVLVQIPTPQSVHDAHPGATISEENFIVNDIEYLKQENTNILCAAVGFGIPLGDGFQHVWRFMLSIDNGATWAEVQNHPVVPPTTAWAGIATSKNAISTVYCNLHSRIGNQVFSFDVNQPSSAWSPLISYAHGENDIHGRANAFAVDDYDAASILVGSLIDVRWYRNGNFILYNGTPPAAGSHTTGHDDVEYIVTHPNVPGLFWVAHHGGVSLTTTSGIDRDWQDRSDGLGVAEVWSMSTSQNKPDYISLALYHDCNAITRTPYAEEWSPDWAYQGMYGDGTLSLIDHKNSNIVYIATQYPSWQRNDLAETSLQYTASWSQSSQYFKKAALNRRYTDHFYSAAFVGNKLEVQRSFSRGANRVVVSDFTNNLEVNHPTQNNDEKFFWFASNPANPNHLYVSLNNWNWQKRIFRNTDIDNADIGAVQANWQDVPHPRRAPIGASNEDREPEVMAIAFHPDNADEIYIAYSASAFPSAQHMDLEFAQHMVYRMNVSDIGQYPANLKFKDCVGLPCEDITMNLPNSFMHENSMAYEQGSNRGLYVAMESGVYFTNAARIALYDPAEPESADNMDNTSGWVRIGDNLPHVVPAGLEINYQANKIRVGTTGRGVWEHDLFCPVLENLTPNITHATGDFLEARSTITSTGLVEASRVVNYRAGRHVQLLPGFRASEGSMFHAFIHPCDMAGNSLSPKSLPNSHVTSQSTNSISEESKLQISPNPSRNHFMVRLPAFDAEHQATITLYDAAGKLVESTSMSSETHQFDLSNRTGLFTVVIHTVTGTYQGRVTLIP